MMSGLATRIEKALTLAIELGGVDGEHHKAWVIDQMIRALTGCPLVRVNAVDDRGNPYSYEEQGESEEYKRLIAEACGEGAEWDVGRAT